MATIEQRVTALEQSHDGVLEVLRAQSEALVRLDDKIDRLDKRMARGFESLDDKMARGFESLDDKMDRGFESLDDKMDRGFEAVLRRLDDLEGGSGPTQDQLDGRG